MFVQQLAVSAEIVSAFVYAPPTVWTLSASTAKITMSNIIYQYNMRFVLTWIEKNDSLQARKLCVVYLHIVQWFDELVQNARTYSAYVQVRRNSVV